MKLSRFSAFLLTPLLVVANSIHVKAVTGIRDPSLNDVSCVSEIYCVSVGEYREESYRRPLILSGADMMWSRQTLAALNPTAHYSLKAVSCVHEMFCVMVGDTRANTSLQTMAWILVYQNGDWQETIVAGSSLSDVSCVSESSCMIGGWQQNGNRRQPLVYRLSGDGWNSLSTSMLTGQMLGEPRIQCETTRCFVSARYNSSGLSGDYGDPAIFAYDQSDWEVVTYLPKATGQMRSSDCRQDYCRGIASSDNGLGYSVVKARNGDDVTVVRQNDFKPLRQHRELQLSDIDCTSMCIASGFETYTTPSSYADHASVLMESSNGWELRVIEPPAAVASKLYRLDCVAESCVSVGNYQQGGQTYSMITLFNGSNWQVFDPLSSSFIAELTVNAERASAPPGAEHMLTASIRAEQASIGGISLQWHITEGPCRGQSGEATTDSHGRSRFKYSCTSPGIDEMIVSTELSDQYGVVHQLVYRLSVEWRHNGPAYVAFGDSITTGASIAGCKDDRVRSPWGCIESNPSATPYPDYVVSLAGFDRSELKRVGIWGDTVQAAAQASRTGRNAQGDWTPQFKTVETATELVTGSLGSNDLRFSDVIFWVKQYFHPRGSRVTVAADSLLKQRSSDFDEMFHSLTKAKQNGAKVVVTLYYNPYDTPIHFCGDLENIGNQLVNALNGELANRSNQSGFEVADFRPAFRNRGSGAPDAYVFGTSCRVSSAISEWLPTWLKGEDAARAVGISFDPHPNNKGAQAMAKVIQEVL